MTDASEAVVVARNVSSRCIAIVVEMALGVVVLPFNVVHLGKAAYGLWMLAASITAYFSILDLGYGGALVKFVAQYRARRDYRALNEILSTTFCLFAALGGVAYLAAIVVALFIGRLFHLDAADAHVGRIVLLVISLNVFVGMAFGVFGGVINGFQRYYLNSVVAIVTTIATAAVNVAVLALGYGLVALVVATTVVRLAAFALYRANAYRVFPELQVTPRLFSRARLRELTSFSVYMLIIDWARRLNYSMDAVVIAAFLNTSAVAIWSVAQRIAEALGRLTFQLSDVLFPSVVDNDVSARLHRLQAIFLIGTRLSLVTVVPIGVALMLYADRLVQAWVGPSFAASAVILQLLSLIVIIRVGAATATTLLKGGGRHRLIALTNLAMGVVNVALSVVLVHWFGLVGVALGTLLPIAVGTLFVVFPVCCRRVDVSFARAIAEGIWPAVWPAAVMSGYVVLTRGFLGESLVGVGAEMSLASLVYVATFLFFGITPAERRLYMSKLSALVPLRTAPAVAEGA